MISNTLTQEMRETRTLRTVLFLDGISGRYEIYVYTGACFIGDPTAYVFRNDQQVWVKPGESVEFIECKS